MRLGTPKRALPRFLAILVLLSSSLFAAEPRIGEERAVLHTIAGDIVLAFYPDVAPDTVKQVLTLMRLGVYDTTHFFRVEPGFVIQVGQAQDRLSPLRPEQLAWLHKIPLEARPDVRHHAWSLSMARMPDDPNSGESSFSILLGDAPHLDGKYTVFGHVERGMDVVTELVRVSRDPQNRPAVRLTIEGVTVLDTIADYSAAKLAPARPVKDPAQSDGARLAGIRAAVGGGLLLIALLAVAAFFGLGGIPEAKLRSLNLVILLVAVFLGLVLFQPLAVRWPEVGGALFLVLVATFRALGRFESA